MHSSEYANFITRQFVALVFRLLVEWQYQKKAVKSLHSKFQFKNDQFLIEVTDFIYLFLLTFPLKVASLNDDTFVRSFYFLILNGSLSLSLISSFCACLLSSYFWQILSANDCLFWLYHWTFVLSLNSINYQMTGSELRWRKRRTYRSDGKNNVYCVSVFMWT